VFTGIIRHVGCVKAVAASPGGRRLSIDLGPLVESLTVGDSVAVNGACLTVADLANGVAQFDVVAETLDRTTLGQLSPRSAVNLERAIAADDRLNGHIVQGHVDGTAEVKNIHRGDRWEVTFQADRQLVDMMIPKGSVAIDGVSLTLADLAKNTFTVSLIPTTLAETTLADLTVGRRVNVEIDVLGKYVQRFLRQMLNGHNGSLTLDKLRDAGFC